MTRRGRPAAACRLRPVRAGDVPAIVAIERASFGDPWSAAAFDELLRNPRVRIIVAERGPLPHASTDRMSDAGPVPADGALHHAPGLIGYVVAWCVVDEAEIANIAVAPEARGLGVGAALLDAAVGDARTLGATTMFLEVREGNSAARRLYASRGFTEIGRRRGYYRKPLEDALVLRSVIGTTSAAAAD